MSFVWVPSFHGLCRHLVLASRCRIGGNEILGGKELCEDIDECCRRIEIEFSFVEEAKFVSTLRLVWIPYLVSSLRNAARDRVEQTRNS